MIVLFVVLFFGFVGVFMTAGWKVIVELKTEAGGKSTQFFYVHISDRRAAVEAIKIKFSADLNINVFAIEPLLIDVFKNKNIIEGGIG